jgi:thymidine phosphorylase
MLHVKVGDRVDAGQVLVAIHANDQAKAIAAEDRLRRAVALSDQPVKPLPLFYGVVS